MTMEGGVRKRSVLVSGHPTSVSLEPEYWEAIADIARGRGVSVNALVSQIDQSRAGNLSSALRVFVLNFYREKAASD